MQKDGIQPHKNFSYYQILCILEIAMIPSLEAAVLLFYLETIALKR